MPSASSSARFARTHAICRTEILDYAEDLLSTFDDDVQHMMFACTGSEANDLAIRIARHHTGNQGIIITSEAYHGNSYLTAGFSPSHGDNLPLGTWVRRVAAPDSYRIGHEELVRRFTAGVSAQIQELRRHGVGVAAFIVDSLFSSDGIYSHPTSLLAPVAKVVREAGGLFIADEVQSGFARSGDAMWGYQRHGLRPDIVTMGKPMGNGFPVAGVALRNEVLASFGHDVRYFNTFGGNTVAIAAAHATLKVIRDEALLENARDVGAFIREEISKLAATHASIGDVRGAGMYIGVEMVSDRDRRTPDGDMATFVVNALREKRILISATGPHSNVLKIRPPLVFTRQHAAQLVAEIDSILSVES
jgi:4-aminobutyrate aminotransferase-like enzyme